MLAFHWPAQAKETKELGPKWLGSFAFNIAANRTRRLVC